MRSKYVRVVAIALAMLVALAFVIGLIIPLISPQARAESTLDELRDSAQALADAKEETRKQLEQLARDKADTLAIKQALDREIELTIAQIGTTTQLIDKLTDEIADRQAALEEAMREEARQMETFRERIRLMEESGEAQYLGVLLSADSFPDLLGRLSSVQDIMDYDQAMLEHLRAARAKVETEKKALEQNKAEQDQVRQELSDHQTELEAQEAEQQRLIDEMKVKEADLLAAEAEQERQEEIIQQEIQNEIIRLEEERRQREEAEWRRQQEESGNSGGEFEYTPPEYVGGELCWPVPASHNVTSPFGMRYHPIQHVYKKHSGIDIAASTGSKVLAANSGTVIKSEYNSGGYGNMIAIDHGGGRVTVYGHLSQRLVSAGQEVSRGETIGLVGSTGMSTGPHLHFEVIINGSHVNPMQFF